MLREGVRIVVEMHQVCSKCVWEFVAFIIYLILPVKLTQGEEEIAVSPWCLLPEGKGTGALGPLV